MKYRVYKFGGSSVGNLEALKKVSDIIMDKPGGLVVIVSAMAGVTDTLTLLAQEASAGRGGNESQLIQTIKERHEEVIHGLVQDSGRIDYLKNLLHASCEELERITSSLSTLGELTPKTLALTVAHGERLMAQVLAQSLSQKVPAKFVDAANVIQLAHDFGETSPDFKAIEKNVKTHLLEDLKAGGTIVMPGFIGRGLQGELVTLGRGGSDYSAAIIGAALDAESVTLYKEVDGLMTADPRFVSTARIVPEMHYREAAELAYYGAKVLHPRTIIPLIQKEIPLIIKNTFDPSQTGTRIAADVSLGTFPVKALTAILNQAIVSVEGKGMMGVPGIAARTFGALAQDRISVSLISQGSSESSICFVVPDDDALRAQSALKRVFRSELEHQLIDDIRVQSKQAILAIVGLGMNGTPGIASRAFTNLYRQKINVNVIAQGSSELNISVVIDEDKVPAALNSLHREYQLEKVKIYHPSSPGEAKLMIYGFGQIGQTLSRQVERQKDYFKNKLKVDCEIVGLADSSGVIVSEKGFNENKMQEFYKLKRSGSKLLGRNRATNEDIQANIQTKVWPLAFEKNIFVDLTASETAPVLREALDHGFHVVLANKKPLAIPMEKYDDLMELARSRGLHLRYEATVGAGLPVLDTLEKLHGAGDQVFEILGCLSGTLGFLMTELSDGTSYSEAVRKAYNMGYTEPDPREDLSGMDVARKALILARSLGYRLNMENIALEPLYSDDLSHDDPQIFIENLKSVDEQWQERVAQAKANNQVLRYVARLSPDAVSVGIEMLDQDSPLGRLRGTDNQVSIRSRRYDDNPLIVTGPGAGADVTAAGVLNDIIAIATSHDKG